MILYAFNWGKAAIWFLTVTLIILILIILYRKLLGRFNRNNINQADFSVLYTLEGTHQTGEIEIYFTIEKPKHIRIAVLNDNLEQIHVLTEGDFEPGGNIVRFDTNVLNDGNYYYCLETENQKTTKKMIVKHAQTDNMAQIF